MLKFSFANVNGIGARSVQKLERIKHHISTTNRHLFFLQELKVKSLPVAFKSIFPEPKFTTYHTFNSQGAAIILNNKLLPNSQFSINLSQSNSSSALHQKLEITDKSDKKSVKFSHLYISPSHAFPERILTEINEFSPEFVLGDPNLTVHGDNFNHWLNNEESAYSNSLVDFPTFRNHTTRSLCTTPDALYPKTDLIPATNVSDSGVIYSDHVRIDVNFASKLKFSQSNETPPTKTPQKYNFRAKHSQISKIWENLPEKPKLFQTRQSLQNIANISKIPKNPEIPNPETTPSDTNEEATKKINQKFQKFCKNVNVSRELGRVWKFIKKHQNDPSDSPNSVKIARNKQRRSFIALKSKLTRDRQLPLTKVQHDKARKVKRILKRYTAYYKNLSFEQVAFSESELSVVLDGLNTGSSAGPDGTTWAAFPDKNSTHWNKILFSINDHLFRSRRITLPPWCKTARLVLVPKTDGSGKDRPISILNFLACIIDRLKQNRLDLLIHADPKLRDRFGFIRTRNCDDVAGCLLKNVENDKLHKLFSCLLQLDLSSAYDLVSYVNLIIALDIFLRRNNAHRTHPHLLLFVHDWTQNRKIIFENTKFSPTNGLPQGAPLSTSLFVIVFNYFPKKPADPTSKITPYFFADDLSLYVSSKSLKALKTTVTSLISDFQNWCNTNDMILNLEKSKILWFCTSEPALDSPIEAKKSVRVLGIQFDKRLTFAEHTSNIVNYCKKFRSPLFYLIKMGLNDSLARQFILGIRSKFTYGLYWLGKIAQTHMKTLETWWTNMMRTWLGARKLLSRKFIFQASGLPKIKDFAEYLLVKRSYFQKSKNLASYPVPSIKESLKLINKNRSRNHKFDRDVRESTACQTEKIDFVIRQREKGSAAAWLSSILKSKPSLANKLTTTTEWPDSFVRISLNAKSRKLKNLWSKSERRTIFERETPEIPHENPVT